ncbi:Wilms tumor protein 1-interacting protein homolog [Sinocyclocheilus grahami]|uniref:Wilms tumor protein 1-interacting protein homolog n=1 Tax=Sinocyclocheilus grahami TaxID=75366 RepID=A0A672S5E3_SINGR|nr:PREDICTED: Wilms tumor protein 1-interacting protein homolog [Sinocyclocheilus grahami]
MDGYDEDPASKLMENLSIFDVYQDGMYGEPNPDMEKTKRMNGSSSAHGNKVYGAAPLRSVNGNRPSVPLDFCSPQRDAVYPDPDAHCTKSEVALPCYSGASERLRRYTQAEVQAHRYSAGCAYDALIMGKQVRSNSLCMASLASSHSSQDQSKHTSPRSSISSPRSSLVSPGQEKYCEGNGVISPRSSYASTASDTSKHSSPRTSLNSYDCGSKPSSNRTSGISMGYDQRHISPRSSTTSPRSSYSPAGNHEPESGAVHGIPMTSPRSSICSHSSRSSRSSMSAYPELQHSMLGPGLPEDALLQDFTEPNGLHNNRVHLQAFPEPQQQNSDVNIVFNYGKMGTGGQRLKLPYQVTPSRDSGPSPAERRLEALTLELEKELEMHTKKEYFGICIKCGKGVYGASQACQAMGNLYHTNCFTCCSCGRRLRGKAFYNINGKVYCEEDFLYSGFQQTAEKCFVCGHLIMEMILQALGKSYHPGCFRCVVCKEGLDGVPFTVDVENNIYCVKDYHRVFAPKCASCNQPILPAQGSEETIRVVSMDKDYHVECYHCEDCSLQLNDEEGHRCYPLDGHLLCHRCHLHRLKTPLPPHPPPSYPLHVTEL